MLGGAILTPAIVIAGQVHELLGLAIADFRSRLVEELALLLSFDRKLPAGLLDELLGFVQSSPAISRAHVAVQLGFDAEEMSEELMLAGGIGFAEIGVIVVGLVKAAGFE